MTNVDIAVFKSAWAENKRRQMAKLTLTYSEVNIAAHEETFGEIVYSCSRCVELVLSHAI